MQISHSIILCNLHNLQRGERILARVEKNIDSLALYLATLRLGAIYVPLNPAYTPRETQHFIEVEYITHLIYEYFYSNINLLMLLFLLIILSKSSTIYFSKGIV